jgi:hypothetical protein
MFSRVNGFEDGARAIAVATLLAIVAHRESGAQSASQPLFPQRARAR